jgi:hypothetical protein
VNVPPPASGAGVPPPAPGAGFPPHVLELFEAEEEVDIETRRADGRTRTTIVWVVVDDGRVYLRSVRGPEGRWYQEARAHPEAIMVAAGQRVPVHVVHAPDPASIEACSRGLRRKYRADPSLGAMLVASVLETTLRLEPAAADAPA